MGVGSKSATVGFKYYLGVQLALCHGAVDSVKRLIVGERNAWQGNITTDGEVVVNAPDLFGGTKAQGGVAGLMKVAMGSDAQLQDPYLVTHCAANVPAYLGLTTVIFKKFYWSAMNPYFKAPWLEVTRILKGWRADSTWYPSKATVNTLDMNPAHIIYQCLTDVDWGMGYSTSDIDDVSFRAAALALHNEGFGISLIWEKQMPIMSFVQIICDHINGAVQLDLKTGNYKLKLIRDDYNVDDLVELTPDNILSIDSFQRLGVGELVTSMTVTYTDRNQVAQTVTAHDLATLESQGSAVVTTREYLGIRDAALAMRVAERDLNTVSAPLAKVSLTVNRVLFDKEKGDEVAFTWPLLGIDKLPMRIIELDKGDLLNGQMRVELIEDVFGFPSTSYMTPQPPLWVDPQQPPAPSSLRKVIEIPYWEIQRSLSPGDFAVFPTDGAALGTLANKPSDVSFDYGVRTAPSYEEGLRAAFAPNALLLAAIAPAVKSITISAGSMLDDVAAGEYAMIGDEIVRVDAINPLLGTMTVGRGCLDTTPVAHNAGAVVFFPQDSLGTDGVLYLSGQSVTVKMLPRTGQGELSVVGAPTNTVSMVGRFDKPYPPGKLRITGDEATTPNSTYPTYVQGALSVTWATRNRLVQNLEDESVGNITSEQGVSYNLYVYVDGVLHQQVNGLSGTVYSPTVEGEHIVTIEVESVRGGIVSFQKARHSFTHVNTGRILTEDSYNITTESGDFINKG